MYDVIETQTVYRNTSKKSKAVNDVIKSTEDPMEAMDFVMGIKPKSNEYWVLTGWNYYCDDDKSDPTKTFQEYVFMNSKGDEMKYTYSIVN